MILDTLDLNSVQKSAIEYVQGPSIVIAGAGSGKTRVLTYKVAYLLEHEKISPYNILVLTFTNKAAREMRERIEVLAKAHSKSLWLGTFHSIFARLLRSESEILGYTKHFTIYDTDDSKSLIKSIVKELNLDDKIYTPNIILSRISGAKNRLITAQQYCDDPICQSDDKMTKRPILGKVFLMYEKRCFKAGAMDFDDILINTHKLFSQNPEILYKYQNQFKHILIDEFQDTNLVQYRIIKDLADLHNNICVVGDDAQSIYAFRGANIYNMLNFKDDFPNTKIFKLEQNYRSTKNIVEAANSIIKFNKNQTHKKSWTDNVEGDLVSISEFNNNIEEARSIANNILDLHLSKYYPYKNFAVLCRTNYQFRSLEEEFRKLNIPYKIVGGMSFYQRKEIKDLIAYLKFIINRDDIQAFKRIINTPKRGIGNTTVDKLIIASYDNDMSLWDTLTNAKHFLSDKVASKIADFVTMIEAASIKSEKEGPYEVGSFIAQRSGMLSYLLEDKTINGTSKYENVQELLSALKNFQYDREVKSDNINLLSEATPDKEATASLADFIQEISLMTSWDEADDKQVESVTLMTVHGSKGLEFEHVYVAGMEEQLFPSALMVSSKEDLEEERRLFYVATTRAKKSLHLSYALKRFKYGKEIITTSSRFLKEIDSDLVNFKHGIQRKSFKPFLKDMDTRKIHQYVASRQVHNSETYKTFEASSSEKIIKGANVEHPRFGFGKVLDIQKFHGGDKAIINFKGYGNKTLLLSFAKLKVL